MNRNYHEDLEKLDNMLNNIKQSNKNNQATPHGPGIKAPKPKLMNDSILDAAPAPPAPIKATEPKPNYQTKIKFDDNIKHSKAPEPPPKVQKSHSENWEQEVAQDYMSLPDEIDMSAEAEDELLVKEETRRKNEAKHMSQFIKFEKATAEDFKDLDFLLKELDEVYVKKSRSEVSIPPVPPKRKSKPKLDDEAAFPMTTGSVSSIDSAQSSNDIVKVSSIAKVAIRIYVENAKMFKTLILTDLMNAKIVTTELKKKSRLDEKEDYVIFELINDHAIERPLREFEIVNDILRRWEESNINALMLKKYSFMETLSVEGTLNNFSRMFGMLFLEVRAGKWIKRYCELKANAIHHSKDSNGTNEAILCYLDLYDVYTLLAPKGRCPTKYCFALKYQGLSSTLPKDAQYVYFMAVESGEKMKDWVWAIRTAKGQRLMHMNRDLRKELENYRANPFKKATSFTSLQK